MTGLNPTGRVLLPVNVDLMAWSARLYEQFAGSMPKLDDPLRWQEWAAQTLTSPDLSRYAIPNPYDYDDWQPWAMAFYAAFRGNL